ncbi:SusF/SusE family outer membrane protein [Gramella jeungdoensis]|uniref:SusF/SusE family outer membrane protein n=1 Tax=Gramella jeungdoensis TaxID=708091 RepID=A0ABT0YXW2_9FLAO|nr:SusF/SusE family outer membrane protein [Gramella jeungdoensis]MCM8568310.1 SusF/SusE family outer membrane protein [Gramella jeungdoensis]
MKKFSILLLTIIALAGFTSCEHDDDIVFTAQPAAEELIFVNSFSSNYTLTSAVKDNLAERFVWNEVDFDAPTPVTYELQGSANADFSSFDVIGTTTETNLGVTIGQMMDLAEDAGLDNDPNTDLDNSGLIHFRVRGYLGSGNETGLDTISNPVSLQVTLPEVGEEEETKLNLYLVGDATAAGWNPDNNNTPLFRDPDNENIFYFTGYFAAGYYKFLEGQAWAPMYGYDGSTLVYRPTEADPDPASIEVASAGYYTITVNVDDLSFSMDSYDASGATTYSTIGYIGNATPGGWDADTDMTQSSFNSHIWYASEVSLADGEMKFRAADDWAVNWGAGTELSGEAVQDGANIPVSEGVYNIWFNDLTGRYILIPVIEE